ncbi:MAG: translation initiation factor IF-2 [Alphaproteobacteria bacterium]|nr:MAG: translation initiation factor IF-2 [Alphaproteobacteria bacterium]
MSDDRKLTLSDKPPSSPAKPAEPARPRPGLLPRRTKPVVVERKRRRFIHRDGGATKAPLVIEENFSLKPKKPAGEMAADSEEKLTSQERDTRAEALKDAIRQAEQDRMRASEEKRQREKEQEALRQETEAKKTKVDHEEDARHRAENEAKHKAEEAAQQKAVAEAEAQKALAEEEKLKAEASVTPDYKKEKPAQQRTHKKEPEKKRHANLAKKKGGERRRSGKLTVTNALDGGDELRPRSLAALKRAKAKQKRAALGETPSAKKSREIVVPESITVQELANRMAEKAVDVIRALINMDMPATMNETIDPDTAELVVAEFGHTVKRVTEADVEIGLIGDEDDPKLLKPRPPVITVMGHVDHGKTSLLDALRQTDVVSGEAGGITQHIGAYQVTLKSGQKITFLDTPGHEAFTEMRSRGAQVTDIVILVVAADDGVMPQTIEAINHAKAAGVPIIVAINKMDVDGANPDRVRNDLLQHEVIVEKMSGDTLDIEVSAVKKTGLDKLEETILLQAELLDLKANPDRPAEGAVVEAMLDKGRGPVATLLIQRGTLKKGDIVVAGAEWGKVRAISDDKGKPIKEAGPSMAVEITGLNAAPSAGDVFLVVDSESRAREVSEYRTEQKKSKRVSRSEVSLEDMFSAMKETKTENFPVVIKADVQGSAEAIAQALQKIGNEEIQAQILHAGVGAIVESDVTLASASDAFIIGFNVRANQQARETAKAENVPIKYYSVIYDVIDEVKAAMEGKLSPAIIETILALVEVKDVFSAGKKGKAAGCIISEGIAKVGAKARLVREDVVIYTGKIESLRRFKDDVKEVKQGTECGVGLENFTEYKPGDRIEVFETEEKKKTL